MNASNVFISALRNGVSFYEQLYDDVLKGRDGAPKGKELEYITSTGVQAIATGVVIGENDAFEIITEVNFNARNSTGYVYGSAGASSDYFGLYTDNFIAFFSDRNTASSQKRTESYNIPADFVTARQTRNACYINDVLQPFIDPTAGQANAQNEMYLFCRNSNETANSFVSVSIKSQKVIINGNLVSHLVGYMTAEGVVCMKDKVSGKLLYNQGTGDFGYKEFDIQSVSDLKKKSLSIGDKVSTQGFYYAGDGGGASYEITEVGTPNETTVFLLDNNLYANLIVKPSMNVLQFGAVSSKQKSSYGAIDAAVNSAVQVLIFPKDGYFLIDKQLFFGGNKTIYGNGSTLYTNDTIVMTDWLSEGRLFYIKSENLVLDTLHFLSQHTQSVDPLIRRQIGIEKARNVTVRRCILKGPDAVYNEDGTPRIFGFTNIDVYSDLDNIIVEDCEMYLTHDGEAGGNITVRDIWGRGTRNVHVRRNHMEKISHDEIVSTGMPNGILENIHFYENTIIMRDGKYSSSAIGITILDHLQESASNITFTDNVVDIQTTFAGLKFTDVGGAVTIARNQITHRRGKGYASNDSSDVNGGYAVYHDSIGIDGTFLDNTVNIVNEGRLTETIIGGNDLSVVSNEINIIGDVPLTLFDAPIVTGNTVNCSGDILELTRNVSSFTGNTVTANAIRQYLRFYDKAFKSIIFDTNTIESANIPTGTISFVISNGGTALPESSMTISNNTILAPKVNNNYLYGFWTPQLDLIVNFISNLVNGGGITATFPQKTGLDEEKVTVTDA